MAAHVTAPDAAHKAGECLGVAPWEFLLLGGFRNDSFRFTDDYVRRCAVAAPQAQVGLDKRSKP